MIKQQLTKFLRMTIQSALDKDLPPPSDNESACLAEAQRAFQELHHSAVKDTSQCHDEWSKNLMELRMLAIEGDLRRFLRWDVVRRTMFVGHEPWVIKELRHLKRRKDYNARWCPGITESLIGHPPPFIFRRGTSGNLVHHAYHLARFEDLASTSVQSMDFVVEFGGGYGSMCRLFHQLGFAGTYVIYDLPEFSILQTYYLKSLGLPIQKQRGISNSGIYCVSNMEQLQILVSNRGRGGSSMFIATWSLSECPLHLRAKVLETVGDIDYWLFGYQEKFGNICNVAYFQNLRISYAGLEWHEERIHHLKGNYYLVGKRGSSRKPK
jgi:hypothetical protein